MRKGTGDHGGAPLGIDLILGDLTELNPGSLLNLGSGTHFFLESRVHEILPSVEMVSVDVAESAETISSNHRYVQCDLSLKAPDLDSKFDVIVSTETLEHLGTDVYFWESLKSYSHPDTRIIVSIPNLASLFCRFELLLGLQPHVLESSATFHRSGMGLGAHFNYGSCITDTGPVGHIRGISYRAIVQLFESHHLKITNQFGFMNSIPFWPRRFLYSLSGNLLFFLTSRND